MIHISTEELFKKIQSEHHCDFVGDETTNSNIGDTLEAERLKSGAPRRQLQFEVNPAAAPRRKSSPGLGQASSRQQQQQDEFCRDMSSILPATYGSVRDSNNNNTAAANEDEVQAVLITGKWSREAWPTPLTRR